MPDQRFTPTLATRQRMQRVRRFDTGEELAIRRELHRRGLRYRVHVRNPALGGRRSIDIAFGSARVAVFVDGCFWHGCPLHGRIPTSNSAWWASKLAANKARDESTNRALREAGWRVVRIWTHESPAAGAARVVRVIRTGLR